MGGVGASDGARRGGAAPVYAPIEEPEALEGAEADAYDAQRFIFCSRAYMFDAAVRRPSHVHRPSSLGASSLSGSGLSASAELDVPSAMPPRFRDAAAYRHAQQQQRLPQLGDGGNATPAAKSADGP